MRRQFSFLLLGATLSVGLAGCADEPAPDDSGGTAILGLDESISCPEGEVGWRFPTKPLDKNSEEYARRSGDNSVVEITERYAIEIQSATCAGRSAGEVNLVRNECAGSLTCRYSPSCSQAFEVTYTCGASDTNDDGTQKTYTATATGGVVEMACTQPAEDAVEVATRTECVPRQCHGRARRNLDMECVENPSATDVAMHGGFETYSRWSRYVGPQEFPYIVPRWDPQTQRNVNILRGVDVDTVPHPEIHTTDNFGPGTAIYPGMIYTIKLWAEFAFGIVPPRSSVVAWVSDTYEHKETKAVVQGFRCVAFKRDLVPENPETVSEDGSSERFDIKYQGTVAEACTTGGGVSEEDAAKKVGLSVAEFREQYDYYNSALRASYDMEGRAAWHKVDFNPDLVEPSYLAGHTPECVPNPQDFFYSSDTGTYDLISYYAQREFAKPQEIHFVEPSVGRRAYIMPGEIKARSDLTIRTTSRFKASLPVDLSWSVANLNEENPFNPWAEGVEIGGAWEDGKSLPTANYGPTNLRASVYLLPIKFNYDTTRLFDNKLGEIPLEGPNPEGTTTSVNLPIPEDIKGSFSAFGSSVRITEGSRMFRLLYCIESDDRPQYNGDALRTRQGTEFYSCPNRDYCTRELEPNYAMSEFVPDPSSADWKNPDFLYTAYSLEVDTELAAKYAFFPFRRTLRGCRVSKGALQITLDRFTTPLEPIAPAGFTGSTKTSETGNAKMSGANDNDNEITCTGQAKDNCVEVVNGGNRTDGESGRSTYDLNSRLGRNPGDEASSSMTAEMLGFQLIDPMDPESEAVDFPADSSSAASTPVTISLAPDWDGIKSALESASTGSATEWETGQYGGQMGLGVGWGFKWRWQIGPVPVLVTFSFTVGASVSVDTEFQFGPTDDQAYPCIGTESCVVKVNEPAGFRDAARDCNVQGGRLAEMSSQAEANAIDQHRGGDDVWLGAQLAYRFPKPACATNFTRSQCVSDSETEYRWMSNSQAFASNDAEATPTYDSSAIYNATESGLRTSYPNDAAVVYKANGTLQALGVDYQKPYLCAFEPAAKERFFRWQLALNMGAAAGFNLTGCVPSDNPGFCLGAGFNVVAFSIGPVYENIYHWLYRAGEDDPYSRRGNTNVSVPWALKLFEGAVTASINILWFSINWNLVSFDGITAAEGKLYDADTPVIESLE